MSKTNQEQIREKYRKIIKYLSLIKQINENIKMLAQQIGELNEESNNKRYSGLNTRESEDIG